MGVSEGTLSGGLACSLDASRHHSRSPPRLDGLCGRLRLVIGESASGPCLPDLTTEFVKLWVTSVIPSRGPARQRSTEVVVFTCGDFRRLDR